VNKSGSLYQALEGNDEREFIDTLLSRKDGLNHLLLTDISKLLANLQTDFPGYVKVGSIGQSGEGRPMEYLELSAPGKADKPAIFMTGATHAREMISTSLNLFEMLKLIKYGAVDKRDKYV